MTSIIAIEKKFEAILKYSTPIGYISHAVLFFGRFCTVNLLNTLHSDDLREWKCDTAQPGCNQICNNRFSPMSHVRFFNLQIIILTFPRLGFYFCSFWEEATVNEKVKEEKNAKDTYDKAKKKYDDDFKKYEQELKKDENAKLIKPVEPKRPSASLTTTSPKKKKKVQLVTAAKVNEIVWTRKIARLYVVHLLFQLIFEISCLWLLNFLQQFQHNVFGVFVPNVFSVPEEYQCSVGLEGSACSLDQNTIPCFNPRAYDKTVIKLLPGACWILSLNLAHQVSSYYNRLVE